MPHYVAFLRGINLGRRRVKMDHLAELFTELGFSDVATFIASGNVLFTTRATDSAKLEVRIEGHLAERLGYEVDTFIRTRGEVASVAAARPFPAADMNAEAHTVHVGFFKAPITPAYAAALAAGKSEVDAFAVAGREVFWLCRIPTNESKVWADKAIKAASPPTQTFRNLNMLRRLAAGFPA